MKRIKDIDYTNIYELNGVFYAPTADKYFYNFDEAEQEETKLMLKNGYYIFRGKKIKFVGWEEYFARIEIGY